MKHLLVLILVTWSTMALARDLPVRSGEHETFTRLVLRVPDSTVWTLEQDGRTASLGINDPHVVFRTDTVFQRIPKDRLLNLSQDRPGAPLVLQLNCDCIVSARKESPFLIVDIQYGSAGQTPDTTTLPEQRYTFGLRPKQALPEYIGQLVETSATRLPERRQNRTLAPDTLAASDLDLAAHLNIAQLQLMEQVARAANQGLLTPKPGKNRALPEKNDQGPGNTAPVLIATTRADRDKARSQVQIRSASGAADPACFPDHTVDVATWSQGQAFLDGLDQFPQEMVKNASQLSADDALALARFFIHFGYGQEAANVLPVTDAPNREARIARSIAQIVDNPGTDLEFGLQDQLACRSDIALWAFLSGRNPPVAPDDPVSEAIMRAFSKLPKHLRLHLGPPLSQRFLAVGNDKRAADTLRILNQDSTQTNARTAYAEADIALYRGQPEIAERDLDTAIKAQDENSPLALAKLVGTHHRQGTRPAEALSPLVGGYAQELRGTELGDRLTHAHVLALVMEDAFVQALDVLNMAASSAHDTEKQSGYSALFSALSERADDQKFLELSLNALSKIAAETDVPTSNHVAQRLMSLGFPLQAMQILDQQPAARRDPERRMLRARIALATNRPNRALVELAGLDLPDVEGLRARALEQSGDFVGAAGVYAQIEDPENAARAHWLNRNWTSVPDTQNGPFAQAADLSERLQTPDTASDGSLRQARSLLDASARARSDIRSLLEIVPATQDD